MSSGRNRRTTQVVPCLPLGAEAVGSYALMLGQTLDERSGNASGIAVAYVAPTSSAELTSDDAAADASRIVRHQKAEALAEALERQGTDVALLHYSAYGFHPRGCPDWLDGGLRRWREAASGRRLVTLFHEVYATGPPWSSSFWLAPRQKRLARSLAEQSGTVVTTTELYARLVRGLFPRHGSPPPTLVLPVFSVIGEPETARVAPLAERTRRLILFGGAGTRARAWRKQHRELTLACHALAIEEVVDVGSGEDTTPPPAEVAGRPVRTLGRVPAREVRSLLLDSMAGFLAYPPELLGKSTVFAAYCSHGVLPVCSPWRSLPGRGGPAAGELWWEPATDTTPSDRALQTIADRAHAWYREHRLEAQSALFRRLLVGLPEERCAS